MNGDHLFEALAGRNPERLVHNALWWALQQDEASALRKLLVGRATRAFRVQPEQRQPRGWRADIVVATGRGQVKLELKVRSGLTANQDAAKDDIDVLVKPSAGRQQGRRVVTWAEVAHNCPRAFADLRALFLAADRFGSATVEETSGASLWRAFGQYLKGGEGSWPTMYGFLWGLDCALKKHEGYEADDGWSQSRRSRYYGFHFRHAKRWCWVGLSRSHGRHFVLEVSTNSTNWSPGRPRLWPATGDLTNVEALHVDDIARWCLAATATPTSARAHTSSRG